MGASILKKVSVIMPAYNHENYIGESIESVLSQTYKNIELVILNDGSADGTTSVIESYAKANPQIRFIDKPNNEGTVAALNELIGEASGDYIVWLSSDDVQYPYTVEKLADALDKNPDCNIAFGGWTKIDENGNDIFSYIPSGKWDKYYLHRLMMRLNIVSGCSAAVRKGCYERAGMFDARFRYAHDYHMYLKLFAENDVVYFEEPLSKIRRHNKQVSAEGRNGADAVRVFFDIISNQKLIGKYLSRIGMEDNDASIVFLIKPFANNLIKSPMQDKREFVYRLKKYLKSKKLSAAHESVLLEEKRFFEIIASEGFTKKPEITKAGIEHGFYTLAKRLGLDGILINKEAVRYHLTDETDPEFFFKKVMPHDNFLCTAEICESELEALKGGLMFFAANADKKEVYKIGITSYMAESAPYRNSFHNAEILVSVALKNEIYRIIVEDGLKNE